MKQLAELRADTDEFDAIAASLGDARETLEVLAGEAGAAEEVDASIASAQERVDRSSWPRTSTESSTITARS